MIRIKRWATYAERRVHQQRAAAQARAALVGHALPDAARPAAIARAPLRLLPPRLPNRLIGHVCVGLLAVAAMITPRALTIAPLPAVTRGLVPDAIVLAAAPPAATGVELVGEPFAAPDVRPAQGDTDAFRDYYTLAEGDTLGAVAQRFATSTASLFWANGLVDNTLLVGQELRIPRVAGIPYIVQPDDTLAGIAAQLNVPIAAITLFKPNRVVDDADLLVGHELFVPGAQLPYPRELLDRLGGEAGIAAMRAAVTGSVQEDETNLRGGPGRDYARVASLAAGSRLLPTARHANWVRVDAGELGVGWVRLDLLALPEPAFLELPETNDFPPPPPRWVWPSYGQLTSPFGWRTVPFRSFHDGLDIANRAGTPIRAARAGRVLEAGWCRGFGYCVKLSHGGGVTTTYGHMLRRPPVSAGEDVAAGDLIGQMGSTYDRAGGGYSTGVHLHFTIKIDGKAVNPMKYLP